MKAPVAFLCGVLFALGLGISGMTRPAKVLGFLDFAGSWDPSLALVMVGAISVHAIAYRQIVKRPSPVLALEFALPYPRQPDLSLVTGAAIFGAGWGMAGFCPGPALTALASGATEVLVFVAAMAVGVYLQASAGYLSKSRAAPPVSVAAPTDS